MAQKVFRQDDPRGAKLKQTKNDCVTGVRYVNSIYKPNVIVDCHMHIQSGRCAPLPFLWGQIGPLDSANLGRVTLEGAGKIFGPIRNAVVGGVLGRKNIREMVSVSKENTYIVGTSFVTKRQDPTHNYVKNKVKLYKNTPELFSICIVMTMDMEYAHIPGYYGLKIYNAVYRVDGQKQTLVHYWMPYGPWYKDINTSPVDKYIPRDKNSTNQLKLKNIEDQTDVDFAKNKQTIETYGIPGIYYDEKFRPRNIDIQAVPALVPSSDTNLYEQWRDQVFRTELAIMANPLKLLPLYHYEPRRWQVSGLKGNTEPFNQVSGSGLFLGFKMYTAQGYRPWDVRRLPILKDFYRRCCTQNIPIMNHCTPEGAPTYDRGEYVGFRHPMDTTQDDKQKGTSENILVSPDGVGYFNRHFVSPRAWKQVLEAKVGKTRLNTLRLCLAHFGGGTALGLKWCDEIVDLIKNYDNVYADISSSMTDSDFKKHFKKVISKDAAFENKIRKKLLFGTDWYLTLLSDRDYLPYYIDTKSFLDDIDSSLWIRFTQVNPYRFYRIDQQINRIAQNIIQKRTTDKSVLEVFKEPISRDDKTKIEEDAAFIAIANLSIKNL
jgi:hypothetical protein